MISVTCKALDPTFETDHLIKGETMEDLKKNVRNHLREMHAERDLSQEYMETIQKAVEKEASDDMMGEKTSDEALNSEEGDEDEAVVLESEAVVFQGGGKEEDDIEAP